MIRFRKDRQKILLRVNFAKDETWKYTERNSPTL